MSADKEILKQVGRIEFSIRKILSGLMIGTYNTALRGQGMTFSDLRPYTPGDDIRNFAWQVMARTGEPFVKQFEEERDLEVHMALDVGPFMSFGGSSHSKFIIQAYAMALIGLSAAKLGDKFGISFFADTMKKIIPLSKGEDHIRRALLDYLNLEDESLKISSKSQVNNALRHFLRLRTKRCMCFLMSDFISEIDEKLLAMVKQKHRLFFIHIFDPFEMELPRLGWTEYLSFSNLASGLINTDKFFIKREQKKIFESKMRRLNSFSRKYGIGVVHQSTHDDLLRELIKTLKLGSSRGF